MNRLGLLLGAALFVAACSSESGSPSATAGSPDGATQRPGSTVAATTAPPPSALPTPTPVPRASCPTGSPITVNDFVNADPVCLGSQDFEVHGWLDQPIAIGFLPPGIESGWLYYPLPGWSTLWEAPPVGESKECEVDGRGCAWFFVHQDLPPGRGLAGPPRWVIVRGHLDDPAASTCHYVYPEDWAEPTSDDADAVAACRTSFVLVSIRAAP